MCFRSIIIIIIINAITIALVIVTFVCVMSITVSDVKFRPQVSYFFSLLYFLTV